jgi:Holliday junction DNA helicase RuvA
MTLHYLQGKVIRVIENPPERPLLILEVGGIGYEIQILSRFAHSITLSLPDGIRVFTHLQIREENPYLYGFESVIERDLFRQLIGVSGIGARLALALIDTLGIEELVGAIVAGDSKTLSRTPGVGAKTAERVALELRAQLSKWQQVTGIPSLPGAAFPAREILEDVEMTLLALGYSPGEIERALAVIGKDPRLLDARDGAEWIKSAIAWLS